MNRTKITMVSLVRIVYLFPSIRKLGTRHLNNHSSEHIKIYNPVSRSKEVLTIKDDNMLTWYTCGPTVYDSAHLGHASCYVKLDIIQRMLKTHFGYNLVTAMNITDVDDKIIIRSKEKGVPPSELTGYYEKEFWQDMVSLNVGKPNILLRVTENIDVIIKFIEKLEKSNMAYKTSDGSVYFDINNYGQYGKFKSADTLENPESNETNKKSLADFALWKAGKEGEPVWDSPWGKGRPGWHIECSALATLAFGSNVDIHAGGIDLRFPHHENEEAQSCAFHSREQWVNHWLHTGHLHLKHSEKMSKSLKNTISIQELLQTTTASVFRMACFMSHYRSSMEYSAEYMSTAESLLRSYKNFISTCGDYQKGQLKATVHQSGIRALIATTSAHIHSAFCDDFDTQKVVKYLGEFISRVNSILHSSADSEIVQLSAVSSASNFVQYILETVGIDLFEESRNVCQKSDINDIMDILSNFRQDVRNVGLSRKSTELLELCDSVRDQLRKNGITVKDKGKKSSWSL